jgi:hypothetical protein
MESGKDQAERYVKPVHVGIEFSGPRYSPYTLSLTEHYDAFEEIRRRYADAIDENVNRAYREVCQYVKALFENHATNASKEVKDALEVFAQGIVEVFKP